MIRLDGDTVGPVQDLVSNAVYSHNHQHILIPEGTIVLGEARKIGSVGFGHQRRISAAFHRLLMPDGYSVDLDQFHDLDQIGEGGLKVQATDDDRYGDSLPWAIAATTGSGASAANQAATIQRTGQISGAGLKYQRREDSQLFRDHGTPMRTNGMRRLLLAGVVIAKIPHSTWGLHSARPGSGDREVLVSALPDRVRQPAMRREHFSGSRSLQ